MGKLRVWLYDEFKAYDADEREDCAWKVPDRRGILYPETSAPVTDAREAAELYAEYFHNQCDGWESTWPLEFVVHDGEHYFRIEVEREMAPDFHASKPKPLLVGSEGTLITVTEGRSE